MDFCNLLELYKFRYSKLNSGCKKERKMLRLFNLFHYIS